MKLERLIAVLLISVSIVSLPACSKTEDLAHQGLPPRSQELPAEGEYRFIVGKVKHSAFYPATGETRVEIKDLGGAFPSVSGEGWSHFPFPPEKLVLGSLQKQGGGFDAYGNPAIENTYEILELDWIPVTEDDLIHGDYILDPAGNIVRYVVQDEGL
ncbi:MAG: hypothetical protein AB7J40_00505 [Candidatus Altimarinota bacterium]